MHKKLTLVVIGAAGVNGIFPGGRVFGDNGLEGVCTPFFQGLRRLDVVVAIDQDGLRRTDVFTAENHRMPGGFIYAGLIGPGFFQKLNQPFRTAVHILFMIFFGAHGGDSQKREKFLLHSCPILLDVSVHVALVSCNYNKKGLHLQFTP